MEKDRSAQTLYTLAQIARSEAARNRLHIEALIAEVREEVRLKIRQIYPQTPQSQSTDNHDHDTI